MKNEKTGKVVAAIAANVLQAIAKCPDDGEVVADTETRDSPFYGNVTDDICTVAELKTLCASVLTQAPDKPKRKSK